MGSFTESLFSGSSERERLAFPFCRGDVKAEKEPAQERATRHSPAPVKPQEDTAPSSQERKSRLKPKASFGLFFSSLFTKVNITLI